MEEFIEEGIILTEEELYQKRIRDEFERLVRLTEEEMRHGIVEGLDGNN